MKQPKTLTLVVDGEELPLAAALMRVNEAACKAAEEMRAEASWTDADEVGAVTLYPEVLP